MYGLLGLLVFMVLCIGIHMYMHRDGKEHV
jgi:hypothetical protein